VLAVNAPVLCEPFKGSLPLHPPEAVQDVLFDEFQVRSDALPLLTVVCEVTIDAVGAGTGDGEEPPPPQETSNSKDATVAK
jgi:hypothetical protein